MSLVPALTAAIILSLASLDFEWKGFVVNGEVAIFCVGLLATSILLTAKELKSPFAHRQLFSLLGIGGVILAMASYAGLCVAGAQSAATATAAKPLSSDEALSLGLGLSLALYIYTIFFSAVVAFVDEVRSDLDETLVREAREALGSSTALQEQFHNLSQEDIDD